MGKSGFPYIDLGNGVSFNSEVGGGGRKYAEGGRVREPRMLQGS